MRELVVITFSLSLGLAAQADAQVTITGTSSQVTTNNAPQFDPSISGEIVVYTDRRGGNDDIYFTDLSTGSETAVTSSPFDQRLHDVSDGSIVFSDFSTAVSQVWVYDVVRGMSSPIESSPFRQLEPTIDGSLVAFEVYDPATNRADVALADLVSGTYTLLTTTPEHEGRPTVGGSFVVFERGPGPLSPLSEIVLHDTATGVETTLGSGLEPHTDGRRVAWRTGTSADADLVIIDTVDGSTVTISYAGAQTRPRLFGDVLAFDDNSLGNPDVVLRHLPSGVEHRIVGTPGASEFLNDIDGNRLVYTSTETGNFDIFLYEFSITGLEPPTPPTDDPCESTAGLIEVSSHTFVRSRGKPELEQASFAFPSDGLDQGVVVVRNDRCASALIGLNGEEVLFPSDFDAEMQCVSRLAPLTADNTLDVELRSKPGCEVTVTVYAVDPAVVAAADVDITALSCDSSSAGSAAPLAAFALLMLLAGRRRRR